MFEDEVALNFYKTGELYRQKGLELGKVEGKTYNDIAKTLFEGAKLHADAVQLQTEANEITRNRLKKLELLLEVFMLVDQLFNDIEIYENKKSAPIN